MKESNININGWHLLGTITVFLVANLALFWFDDNYNFKGDKIVKNKN